MNYQKKYLKYKQKYLNLTKQLIIQKGNGHIPELDTALYEHIYKINTIREIADIINLLQNHRTNDDISRLYPGYDIDKIKDESERKMENEEISTQNDLNKNFIHMKRIIESDYIADNFNEAVIQCIGRIVYNILYTNLYLLYNNATILFTTQTLKIINARGDGECFYHALYLYIKLFDNQNLQLYDDYKDDINFLTIMHISGIPHLTDAQKQIRINALDYTNFLLETDDIIHILINNLKYNIMIIAYNQYLNTIHISASNIENPRYYIMLLQRGPHYNLIYISNEKVKQQTYYENIYNTYQVVFRDTFVNL